MVYLHTKNPNLGIFGGPWNGKCWYFKVHLKYFTALWPFGTFPRIFGMLVKKNLATLNETILCILGYRVAQKELGILIMSPFIPKSAS
jgi:hypothetical protein